MSDWLDADPRRADKLVDICFDTPLWKPEDGPSPVPALIRSSADFIAAYVPPDYLIDGLLQRRYCYSFTGRTGEGKTAIALRIAAHIGTGMPLAGHEVEKGRVLMFAGENPDDVRARWLAMSQQMDFDLETIEVYFVPGRFKISELIKKIRDEVAKLGGVLLLIIDTSAAYFEGDDENSNVQLGGHASRLRELSLPGGPTTIINCHPTKNAADDNLVPRGGGAFLAEVDGNLVCKRDDTVVKLHWQGKFRGPDFAPITFQLRSVSHERLRDTKNRVIPTVVAEPLSEMAEQELTKVARSDEDRLLQAIGTDPTASIAALAKTLGWLSAKNEPHKSKVHRVLGRLKDARLLATERGQHMLTEKGSKVLKKMEKNENAFPTEPFHREWNDFAHRSDVPPFCGTGGTMSQGKVQESRVTSWFLAVPQGGTIALKERLKVSFRVPFRSTPFPRGPRGTLAATKRGRYSPIPRGSMSGLRIECKARADCFRQLYYWLNDRDLLIVKRITKNRG